MNGTTSSTKPDSTRYASRLSVLFPPLACVDVPALVGACKDAWYIHAPYSTEADMPLARVDIPKGRAPEFRAAVGDVAYATMIATLDLSRSGIGSRSPANMRAPISALTRIISGSSGQRTPS